jgi:hypothetical protein
MAPGCRGRHVAPTLNLGVGQPDGTTDTMHIATTIVYALTLVLYATWFGIAVYMVIAPCYDELSAPTFIEWFQKIDPYMRVRARQLLLAQLLLTLMLLGLTLDRSSSPAFWLTAVALMTTIVAMVIAIRGNVPINLQMEKWSPSAPPADWQQVRERWLRYHRQRGLAETAGFVAMLVATLLHASST